MPWASCASLGQPVSPLGLSFLEKGGIGTVKDLVETAGSGGLEPGSLHLQGTTAASLGAQERVIKTGV